MDLNEIKKDLYKTKVSAKLDRYCHGNVYYNVEVLGNTYQFPIATTETVAKTVDGFKFDTIGLSSDLGTTPFHSEMKASELNRWIKKAFENGEFVKIY